MGTRHGFESLLLPAMRRVDGVRLIVGDGTTRAEVYGIGHRFPTTARVSLTTASRLVQAGAPLTIKHDSGVVREAERVLQ